MRILLLLLALLSSCSTRSDKQKNNSDQHITPIPKYTKIISDSTNKLTGTIEGLEISYVIFGCNCPNWIRTKDTNNSDTTKKFRDLYFYIEPAEEGLDLPLYFEPSRHSLKIVGQFYVKEDYPQGTVEEEEPMPRAKVFRYTKLEVIDKPDFNPGTKTETLTLDYNAIACTCAQWSESKYAGNPGKKVYYWLEPADKTLIPADKLFNGNNLPVQIKVTGQIVSENGFPKIDLQKVAPGEAGKVFRYTKIEVIKK